MEKTNHNKTLNKKQNLPKVKEKMSPSAAMVNRALQSLPTNSKKGVSLYAIKKFISDTYNLGKISTVRKNRINDYLRNLLNTGVLINVNSKGLSGRFRFAPKPARIQKRRTPTIATDTLQAQNKLLKAPMRPVKSTDLNMGNSEIIETPQSSRGRRRFAEQQRSLSQRSSGTDTQSEDFEISEVSENYTPRKKRKLHSIV